MQIPYLPVTSQTKFGFIVLAFHKGWFTGSFMDVSHVPRGHSLPTFPSHLHHFSLNPMDLVTTNLRT